MKKVFLSEQRLRKLKKQLKNLQQGLKNQQDDDRKRGGSSSSWHEAASYSVVQGAAKSKIKELEFILSIAKELPDKVTSDKAVLGSYVTIKDNKDRIRKYRLVDPLEATPEKALLSIESPLGQLILNNKENDTVKLNKTTFTIVSIESNP